MFCFLLKVSHKAEMKIKIILDVWDEFLLPQNHTNTGLIQIPAAHALQPLIQGKHFPKGGELESSLLTSVAVKWTGPIVYIKLQVASSRPLFPLSP